MTVTPIGTEFQVNTFTTGTQFSTSMAVEADGDGDFIITWSSNGQDGNDFGIYAQRYSADGTPEGSEFQVNTFTTGFQFGSAVAVDEDGDFIITWTSYGQDGDDRGIFAQRYNADGTQDGSEFQVNSFTTGSQDRPAVAADEDGNFIITWDSFSVGQDDISEGIFAQRYNADGTPNGSEFRVNVNANNVTSDSASEPKVAVDNDGDFIITWSNFGQDGNDNGVFVQLYNADGTPNGSEFQVNTNVDNLTTSLPFASAVAVDNDGDFIIAWSSYRSQDGDGSGIFARRYNADGTPEGSEFQVNTFTTDSQSSPAVAVDEDGNFIITWNSSGQDGSGTGVFAQYYNADGTPEGSEFQVNTFTTDSQSGSAVAVDGNGDFIITWNSYGQDGDSTGVFAQRYSVDGVTGLNLEGGNGKDTLTGGEGDDTISGGNGKDRLFGLAGDDIIRGDNGSDLLNGGLGNDTLDGGLGRDTLRGGADNDLLRGNSGFDLLSGNNGNDALVGGNGNDILRGDAGEDTLDGGNGNDSLFGGNDADLFTLRAGEGIDSILDYRDGVDKFLLADGLEFGQIEVVQNINNTQIKLNNSDEVLANLNSVTANFIDATDFMALV